MEVVGVERVERPLPPDSTQELLLGQRVDAVVAQDVVPVPRERRELPVDAVEVAEFDLGGIGGVDEVAQLDEEVGPVPAEPLGGLGELRRGLPVVA